MGSGEVVVFAGALLGSGLGFLWFNTYPAQIFMGDVGSLALGAALAVMAIISRHEVVFFHNGRDIRSRDSFGNHSSSFL